MLLLSKKTRKRCPAVCQGFRCSRYRYHLGGHHSVIYRIDGKRGRFCWDRDSTDLKWVELDERENNPG